MHYTLAMMTHEILLNEVFATSEICYNFGSAVDILNPLIHTNCKTMICIDIKDNSFYKRYIANDESHLPVVVNLLIKQIGNLNKKITNMFEDICVVLLEKMKFVITLKYKGSIRNIIYYVGYGNVFIPPEIEEAKNNNTLDCIWWSMSYLKKSTIDYLRPKHIIVHHTRLEGQLVNFIVDKIVNTIRVDPWANKCSIQDCILTVYVSNNTDIIS